jgi:MurNAc alpha-1-phosphate uridylyltransferase
MKAMILAAGKGERMGTLTENTSKVLLKVNGKALIEYHLENLAHAGVTDVVINLCYHANKIRQFLGNGEKHNLNIEYSLETELLGLGGGVHNALHLLGNKPFFIISADMWTNYNYADLPKNIESQAHLVMTDNPPFHPNGDYPLENGIILMPGKNNLNYAGFGVFHPDLFRTSGAGSYGIAKVINPVIEKGLVTGEHFRDAWMNINTPKELEELREKLERS